MNLKRISKKYYTKNKNEEVWKEEINKLKQAFKRYKIIMKIIPKTKGKVNH